MTTTTEKSCDPQLSHREDGPNSKWPLSELSSYAKTEQAEIQQREESLAVSYWRLGHALTLAKRHLTRGQWGKYLAELGIEKTRSSKAMAIYRTFPDMSLLEGVSVDAAYKQRKRNKKAASKDSTHDPESETENSEPEEVTDRSQGTLHSFFVRLREDSEHWIHEAAFAEKSEARELIGLLDEAMAVLQEIHGSLQVQLK